MVVGVLGGSGGIGASSFAAAVSAASARRYGRSVLIDLDPARGGVDVLLGIEAVPGARWSGLRLGGGRLEPQALADGLPHWGDVAVLAADRAEEAPVAAVHQVIEVAREAGPVVADLARGGGAARDAALARCDLVVLLVRPDVAGIAGARTVAAGIDAPMGLLVRGRPDRGVDQLVGAPRLGRLPRGSLLDQTRRVRQVAAGVLDAVERAR